MGLFDSLGENAVKSLGGPAIPIIAGVSVCNSIVHTFMTHIDNKKKRENDLAVAGIKANSDADIQDKKNKNDLLIADIQLEREKEKTQRMIKLAEMQATEKREQRAHEIELAKLQQQYAEETNSVKRAEMRRDAKKAGVELA